MSSLAESLSPAVIETVRCALRAAVEGSFFPDWEFQTLIGVDRDTVKKVYTSWPRPTVEQEEFTCAIVGSMSNLVGYLHGMEDELAFYIPGGRQAIENALNRVSPILTMPDYSRLEEDLRQLTCALGSLAPSEISDVEVFLAAGEYGIAFETLCAILWEEGKTVPNELRPRVRELAERMEIDPSWWEKIAGE
jgi:hypothetical protein